MPRKPTVRYWQRKGGGYFTTISGEQVELALGPDDSPSGPTYLAAVRRYATIMEGQAGPDAITVRAVIAAFRERVTGRERHRFDSALRSLDGSTPVRSLLPRHVTEWLAMHPRWKDGMRRAAISYLNRALNWAAREGIAPLNPLRGRLSSPEASTRGELHRLPRETCDLLESKATGAFRLFVRLLRHTGCRPIEARQSLVKNLRPDSIVLPWNPPAGEYRHKTAKKTKRDRVIMLPTALAEDIHRQASGRSPTSPLLLNSRGRVWTEDQQGVQWRALVAECGLDSDEVVPYSLRHTWASDALDGGMPIKVCAALLGTSVAMLERVYCHHDRNTLRQWFDRAVQ